MTNPFRQHWALNPNIDFLNHGSFGATPTCVLDEQRRWRDLLEHDPIQFLAPERELEPKLDHVRAVVAGCLSTSPKNIAWVRNATEGVNAVLRSFKFLDRDQILVTDHGYNACNNAAQHAANLYNSGHSHNESIIVKTAHIPFPLKDSNEVIDAIEQAIEPRTRLLMIDHVTSPTGLVFPIHEIVQLAKQRNVRVLVDGAHAPGMLSLNLDELGPDYYTANHHKWLCGPKVSGFLWVHPDIQHEVRPTVISHAANRPRPNRSSFLAEFDWTGTFDPTPLLALPYAIEFLDQLYAGGLQELMEQNHRKTAVARNLLLNALELEPPAPEQMLGSLATIPIPGWAGRHEELGTTIRQRHRFELPVFNSPVADQCLLRISMQAYNDLSQIERLAATLRKLVFNQ